MKNRVELLMAWAKENVGSACGIIVVVMTLVVVLAATTLPKSEVKAGSGTSTTPALPEFSSKDGMPVLLNMYTYVDEVCSSNNQYFVHFEDGKEEGWHGWYLFKEFHFYQLANGTWYHNNVSDTNLISITHINTAGLECIKSGAP